jgi:hypothetical protein
MWEVGLLYGAIAGLMTLLLNTFVTAFAIADLQGALLGAGRHLALGCGDSGHLCAQGDPGRTIWAVWIATWALALLIALVIYARAAYAAAEDGQGALGAVIIAVLVVWALNALSGIAAIFAQVSPATATNPPPAAMDPTAYHASLVPGIALLHVGLLLPAMLLALLATLPITRRARAAA